MLPQQNPPSSPPNESQDSLPIIVLYVTETAGQVVGYQVSNLSEVAAQIALTGIAPRGEKES